MTTEAVVTAEQPAAAPVAAQEGAVGEDAAIADAAVVGDVAAGHEEVAAADDRLEGLRRAAVDGDVLAEDVVVADDDIALRCW